ncbi:hypothetical protein H0H81_006463 [Sphagnurus paluster]|uniref:Uncharacterized protein n=1 Tax=Sphagnurus paluster TaxID=117069 RepID=A0A9P7K6K5_9AGAR|nr:hypothetical protein H0H81_006463 [Sphagnurus paluster]
MAKQRRSADVQPPNPTTAVIPFVHRKDLTEKPRSLEYWTHQVPYSLQQLQERQDITKLNQICDKELGIDQPAQCVSALFVDKEGENILAYFGDRVKQNQKYKRKVIPLKDQYHKRTLGDINDMAHLLGPNYIDTDNEESTGGEVSVPDDAAEQMSSLDSHRTEDPIASAPSDLPQCRVTGHDVALLLDQIDTEDEGTSDIDAEAEADDKDDTSGDEEAGFTAGAPRVSATDLLALADFESHSESGGNMASDSDTNMPADVRNTDPAATADALQQVWSSDSDSDSDQAVMAMDMDEFPSSNVAPGITASNFATLLSASSSSEEAISDPDTNADPDVPADHVEGHYGVSGGNRGEPSSAYMVSPSQINLPGSHYTPTFFDFLRDDWLTGMAAATDEDDSGSSASDIL